MKEGLSALWQVCQKEVCRLLVEYSDRTGFVSNRKAPQSLKGLRRFLSLFYSVLGIRLLVRSAACLSPMEGARQSVLVFSTFPQFVLQGSIKGKTVNSLTWDCQPISK